MGSWCGGGIAGSVRSRGVGKSLTGGARGVSGIAGRRGDRGGSGIVGFGGELDGGWGGEEGNRGVSGIAGRSGGGSGTSLTGEAEAGGGSPWSQNGSKGTPNGNQMGAKRRPKWSQKEQRDPKRSTS